MKPANKLKRTVLCVAALAFAALGAYGLWARPAVRASGKEASAPARVVAVRVTPAAPRSFEQRLTVQGNLKAENSAMVAARVGGTVEAIFVKEGAPVVAGETRLFHMDDVKLRRAADMRRDEMAVAECACREAEANLERLEAVFEKAGIDHERAQRLYERSIGSLTSVEQVQSALKQAAASVKHGRSQVDLARQKQQQARSAVAIAEKDLSDAQVVAPISGRVSARLKEPGENASVGEPVVRIDDLSSIEVSAFLPAQYYPQVAEGKTHIRLAVNGKEVGEPVVTYKSPTINPALRTFEVKALVRNPPEGVVPGAMAEVGVLLEQRQGIGIPARAVVKRGDRDVVFVVEQTIARMVTVETGLETDGWIEITDGAVPEGAAVVTMGQTLINEGETVTLQEGAA